MVVFLLSCSLPVSGQGFLQKVLDATEDKVSDEAADEISDEMAKEAENLLNDLFGNSEEASEPQTKESSQQDTEIPEQYQGFDMDALNDMMGAMDQSANLPASYNFDFVMDVTVSATGEPDTDMQLLFNTSSPKIFGMSVEQEGQWMTFIYDGEKSLNVIYNVDEKGNKKGTALPDMMQMAASYGGAAVEDEMADVKITRVGPGKNVAGYPTVKYVGSNEESKGEMFVSDKLPVSWEDSYFGIMQNMSLTYTNEFSKVDGMMLEMNSTDIETGEETSWVTTSAEKKTVSFNNSEYNFSNE